MTCPTPAAKRLFSLRRSRLGCMVSTTATTATTANNSHHTNNSHHHQQQPPPTTTATDAPSFESQPPPTTQHQQLQQRGVFYKLGLSHIGSSCATMRGVALLSLLQQQLTGFHCDAPHALYTFPGPASNTKPLLCHHPGDPVQTATIKKEKKEKFVLLGVEEMQSFWGQD